MGLRILVWFGTSLALAVLAAIVLAILGQQYVMAAALPGMRLSVSLAVFFGVALVYVGVCVGAGVALGWRWRSPEPPPFPMPPPPLDQSWLGGPLPWVISAALLFAIAALLGGPNPARTGLAVCLGAGALIACFLMTRLLSVGETIEVTSWAGGLGGARTGFRFSRPTTLLLFAVVLAGASVGMLMPGAPDQKDQAAGGTHSASSTATPSEAGSTSSTTKPGESGAAPDAHPAASPGTPAASGKSAEH